MAVVPSGMLRCTVAEFGPEKAEYRLLFGMVIAVRPVQPKNAPDPMLVTRLETVMLVRPVQPKNALDPMLVTLCGIVMLVRPLQSLNALGPILVTLSGIVTLVSCGQFE